MSKAVLTIASKNYGSWSLRGWLLCKMARIDFEEEHVSTELVQAPHYSVHGLRGWR
jgi:glutathione S-transferase